jgi:D-3-phosphoglycerate dehydrogenase
MLYCRNEDKPGIVGGLGKLLGDNQVNIATFHLGRDRPGGQAIALLAIDQRLSGDLLDCVRELPHVNQVRPLRF